MSKKRIIWLAGIVCLAGVAAAAVAAAIELCERPAKHFRVVEEGVMYRGAQPDEEGLEQLFDRYKVKTVVNLRGPIPKAQWWQTEKDACDKHGVRMIDIRLNKPEYITPSLKEFFEIAFDKSNYPIYVHCEIGTARTGFAVAAWRIVKDKWTFDRALEEAKSNHFNPEADLNPQFVKMLRSLSEGADWRQTPELSSRSRD